MNILRVIPSLDPRGGGPAEAASRMDRELISRGHSVEAVTLDAESTQVDYPFRCYKLGPGASSYRYSSKFLKWLKSNCSRYDVIIVDGLWQYHSYAVWRALRGAKTPYFLYTHGMLDPWFKKTYPLKHLKKLIYWTLFERRVLQDATGVLFTCEEERILAAHSFPRYSAKEIVASFGTKAPPPDDDGLLRQKFLLRAPELAQKRFFLFLSRVHEKKGCDLLINAFARLRHRDGDEFAHHLVIAGPGEPEYKSSLVKLAKHLNVSDRIHWFDMLSGDVKWGAFYSAEAFCLISHQENFGIVVAEALGCGTPVLISNKVNIWREIQDGGCGFVGEDTIDGAVEVLSQWKNLSPLKRQEMRNKSLSTFQNHFDISHAAEELICKINQSLRLGNS